MQARFLLGPAGSGKTFRCLAEIRAALRKNPGGPPLILLAPKQATFQLERQLLAGDEISGYTRLHIFSFDRLARFVLENFSHRAAETVVRRRPRDGAARIAAAARGRIEIVPRQRPPRRVRAGIERAARTNSSSTSSRPPNSRARRNAPRCAAELRGKLHDLALLRKAYARWLAEHELQDANHLLDFATDALRRKCPLSAFRFPRFRLVAGRFRRNDAAGTGFARRHSAVLRTRHARVLPRQTGRQEAGNFLAFDLDRRRQNVFAMPPADRKSAGLQNRS